MAFRLLAFAVTFLPCLLQALVVCLAGSEATPKQSIEGFSERFGQSFALGSVYQRVLMVESEAELLDQRMAGCDLVLDATVDRTASVSLDQICDSENLPKLPIYTAGYLHAQNTIRASDEDTYADLVILLRHFNWTSVSLLYSPNTFGLRHSAYLDVNQLVAEELIVSGTDIELIRKAISRRIKRFGSSVVVVATSLNETSEVLACLRDENMLRAGFVVIVVGEGVWGTEAWPGLLLLKEEDCVDAQTRWQCDADTVAAFILRVSQSLNIAPGTLSREDFNYYLSRKKFISPSLVLVNTHKNKNQLVGRFNIPKKEIYQTGMIYYQGNVTNASTTVQGLLEISFNSGLENPTSAPTAIAQGFYNGQKLGVMQINHRSDLLHGHTLVSNDMAFGAIQWNASWATSRVLSNKDRLGLTYMSGYASAVTMNTLLTLNQLNLSRPAISSSNSFIALGNSTAFPWFVRNGISDLYFAALYSNILPEIGWKRCAVLYGDDVWGNSVYSAFKELADFRHIEILNNVTMRKIPSLVSKQTYWQQYRENLLELFRCNARVVLLFILDPGPEYILELLFDLGARKGDFVITGSWLSANYFTTGTALNIMKRKELLEGTVGFSGTAWIGEIGAQVKKDMAATFNDTNPSPFTCFYYDSVFALAHAIDTCIHLGLDYTNPIQLMKILRETRFTGCTGFVSWQTGDNNRAYVDYNIMNLQRDPVSGNYSLKIVGRYSPTSTLLYNFTDPFIFGDGTSVVPSDLRVVFGDCPFEDKLMKQFPAGHNLAIGICVVIMILTILLSILLYKKVWRVTMTSMKKAELSMEDVVFMGTIGVEAVQLAAIGPDFKSLDNLLMDLAKLFTMDLSSVINFRNGVYWLSLNITFGVVAAWVVLNLFSCFRLDERLKRFCIVQKIGQIAYSCLPLLGTVCFLPIVFILVDVFICDTAVGYSAISYHNSILTRDCYVSCWSHSHSLYVVFVSLSLACYIPSAILLKPVWFNYQHNLHIETSPLFLVVKSIVQVVLICLSKTLKRWKSTIHAILFLCVLSVYICFVCTRKIYNYSRANLWQGISLICVFELALIALINDTLYRNTTFKLVIMVGVLWSFLISTFYSVFGLVYEYFCLPSLLYRKKGRDFSKILRFAFTNQVEAAEIQPKLNYLRSSQGTGFTQGGIVNMSELPNTIRRIPANLLVNS